GSSIGARCPRVGDGAVEVYPQKSERDAPRCSRSPAALVCWYARFRRSSSERTSMVRGILSLARAAGLGPLTALTACPARRGGQGREPRGAAPARGRWGSEPLLDHVSEQVDAAVRVAPLVVVPAHELEEVAVE